MDDDGSATEATQAHAAAYAARYARAQIQNIVNTLVPAQELLDAHLVLALAYLERA
jgi:hypothetical protein